MRFRVVDRNQWNQNMVNTPSAAIGVGFFRLAKINEFLSPTAHRRGRYRHLSNSIEAFS